MTRFDHLIRIADRLRALAEGSAAADEHIHQALGLTGPALPYTRSTGAALALVPEGYEADWPTTAGGQVYGAVRRQGLLNGLSYPHHGQWGTTRALALCGALMRAYASLAKGS